MEKIRMAVIGIGTMGKKYAKMIQEGRISGMCLGAVCCRSHESSQWAKAELGGELPVFQDTEKLFDASELFDACLIVTPQDTSRKSFPPVSFSHIFFPLYRSQ